MAEQFFRHPIGRHNTTEIAVTFGKPNYEEREFIAKCRKSGESFPIRKIQLKFSKPKACKRRAA